MPVTTIVTSINELEQILKLQQENLPANISENEIRTEGFVTLRHDLAILKQMHDLAPSVIIKNDDIVIGYALTMLKECRRLVPDLETMFAQFDEINWKSRALNSYRFYVMGQVCIAKAWRGKELFKQLYLHHKKIYKDQFDLFITEIATRNHRSVRAHEKMGFKTVHTYRDTLDEWIVMAWDWN